MTALQFRISFKLICNAKRRIEEILQKVELKKSTNRKIAICSSFVLWSKNARIFA